MSLAEYVRVDNYVHAVTLARLFAMSKFSLLLLGLTGLAAVIGGALRLFVDFTANPDNPPPRSFKDLVDLETDRIFAHTPRRTKDNPECTLHGPADEQFVHFRAADVIGLALSGGGIRSATFNLGLLQGMQRIGVLRLFDYVATVSGGGYIGSFWSEWLVRETERAQVAFETDRTVRLERAGNDAARRAAILAERQPPLSDARLFPTACEDEDSAGYTPSIDTNPERHLREF